MRWFWPCACVSPIAKQGGNAILKCPRFQENYIEMAIFREIFRNIAIFVPLSSGFILV